MDDFVREKLTEWGLSKWIDRFKDEEVDEENFYHLDQELEHLIPKDGPRAKFRERLKLLKEKRNTTQETNDVTAQEPKEEAESYEESEEEAVELYEALPSTSATAKRPLDPHGESSKEESPAKRQCDSYSEENILSAVKKTMGNVHSTLHKQNNTKLNAFLKTKIDALETDKRELVGVFGKTGAGKSSLINAIIGEKDLLPTGDISSCTTVMIKVEANMHNSKYEAGIEFITKEEWKEELWSLDQLRGRIANQERGDDDNDSYDFEEKLSALYGEEYKKKNSEKLMKNKYFKEIPEFLHSSRKTFTCQSAKELSAKLIKYTKSDLKEREGTEERRFYWPLVKCVTVKVPENEFLQHVTLVDLPGNGSPNKSRDKMWNEIVGKCSTVWIVTDITRAASEKEPWEILKNASSIMEGNGGECQHIHFICTKSDLIHYSDYSAADVRALILRRNEEAKEKVMSEFNKQNKIKKHFSDNCFEVFTVSSKEFPDGKYLSPVETEIPKLQEFLQNLNDCHSETLNYVSGAYGILSLIQGARCREGASRTDVCANLEGNMSHHLDQVRINMEETNRAFENCLSEGVEKSKSSCERQLKSFLTSRKSGTSFHRILKSVVQNNGIYKPKEGRQINLNMKLSSHLTDSIYKEFKKTFPNDRACEPFNGVISRFTLNTGDLIQKYKDVELPLIFLQTEEKIIKTMMKQLIRNKKKTIYSSLTDTIKTTMKECYERAAGFSGEGTLKNMKDTLENHVRNSKNIMFELAKNVLLKQLKQLEEDILKTLETTMRESIDLSLKTDEHSIPDVSDELEIVKKRYDELRKLKKLKKTDQV